LANAEKSVGDEKHNLFAFEVWRNSGLAKSATLHKDAGFAAMLGHL
jgi:hypothetical protein